MHNITTKRFSNSALQMIWGIIHNLDGKAVKYKDEDFAKISNSLKILIFGWVKPDNVDI